MSKHTPGPWEVCHYAANQFCGVESSDERMIADTGFRPISESQANARLIAAAPDLLEALQTLCACMACYDGTPEELFALESARAAISKATGEA